MYYVDIIFNLTLQFEYILLRITLLYDLYHDLKNCFSFYKFKLENDMLINVFNISIFIVKPYICLIYIEPCTLLKVHLLWAWCVGSYRKSDWFSRISSIRYKCQDQK